MLSLGAAQKSRGLSPGTGNSSSRACCGSLPMKLRPRADALAERRATLKRPRNFIFVFECYRYCGRGERESDTLMVPGADGRDRARVVSLDVRRCDDATACSHVPPSGT